MPDLFDIVDAPEKQPDIFDSIDGSEAPRPPAGATLSDLMSGKYGTDVHIPKDVRVPTVNETGFIPAPAVEGALRYGNPFGLAQVAAERFDPNNPVTQAGKGAIEGLSSTIAGATTPENLSLLALAPEGKLAQRLIAGTFLGQSIAGTPEQWDAFNKADNLTDKFKIATEMGLGIALPAAALAHGFRAGEVPRANTSEAASGDTDRIPTERESIGNQPTSFSDPSAASGTNEAAQQTVSPPVDESIARYRPQNNERSTASQPETTSPIAEPSTGEPNALPIRSATQEVPSPIERRQDQPIGGERVRSSEQGQEIAGEGGAPKQEATERVNDDPFVSRIANRFTEERAAQGEIGEVAPGDGYAAVDLVQRGLKMDPEEVNQHVSDLMNDGGGDPIAQAAAVRAEEARLSDKSIQLSKASEANPTDVNARRAANSAFSDLTDFHNGPVAKLKERFHATGMALQGEIPVDLSTFNGLREAWLKDTGKAPPSNMDSVFRRTAENVRRSVADEAGIRNRLSQEIDRASSARKLPSPEEVRNRIMERMKEEPCRV